MGMHPASFIVMFKMNIDQFIDLIYEEFRYDYFTVTDLISDYKKQIQEAEQKINKGFGKGDARKILSDFFIERSKDHIKLIKNSIIELETIKNLDDYSNKQFKSDEGTFVVNKIEAVKFILKKVHNVHLKEIFSDITEITAWSMQHNSCYDIPNIIKDILTYFDFKLPMIEKHCKIDYDSY